MTTAPYKGIALFGPTASGKTSLSIQLAKALGGEVVNADSRQLYTGMPLLTAVPSAEEMKEVPHHLFEVHRLKQKCDALTYAQKASACIEDVLSRGKVPILCGGTGFYMQVLLKGISEIPSVSKKTQQRLLQEKEGKGMDFLYAELFSVDPVLGEKLHIKDTQRVLRALGVHRETGKPLSYFQSLPLKKVMPYSFMKVALLPDVSWLNDRIEKRFSQMLEAGVEDEMHALFDAGYVSEDAGMETLGAREFFQYFKKEVSKEAVCEKIVCQTKRYAKRQRTWARTQFDADVVIDPADISIDRILEKYQK